MTILNSYVSLPEGTSGDILDGKISTPKAKKKSVSKAKQTRCW